MKLRAPTLPCSSTAVAVVLEINTAFDSATYLKNDSSVRVHTAQSFLEDKALSSRGSSQIVCHKLGCRSTKRVGSRKVFQVDGPLPEMPPFLCHSILHSAPVDRRCTCLRSRGRCGTWPCAWWKRFLRCLLLWRDIPRILAVAVRSETGLAELGGIWSESPGRSIIGGLDSE